MLLAGEVPESMHPVSSHGQQARPQRHLCFGHEAFGDTGSFIKGRGETLHALYFREGKAAQPVIVSLDLFSIY